MAPSDLTLEQWPVERLIDYARNPRKNDHAVEQMAAVITEFGFRIPVVARSTGEILDGHLRLKAARRLGLTSVPVVLADELTDAQIKAFRLLANRSATWAEWDDAMLTLELEDLKLADFDLSLTGFDAGEIEALLADDHTDAEPPVDGDTPDAADDVPEVPTNPVSRLGDVWALGKHRLICGDATDTDVIATLMAGDRARVCFTSPPYGNQRDYTSGGITDWDGLMRGVFADLPMTNDGQVLVNLGLIHRDNEVIPYWDGWVAWMRTQGWRRFAWYVWDQGPGMPGDWAGRFAPSFEFVFHFNHQSRKPNKIVPCKHAGQESHLRADGSSSAMRGKDGEIGGWTAAGQPTQDNRIPDSVIRVMRHKGKIGQDIDHPAVFPIALPEFILEAYSGTGDIVFEPFCGSGTTILAAQRTGRLARSVEIAPEYVDVAIKRFQQNFAGVPVTLAATGQTFVEVTAERLGSDDADR
ncbi:DNA modification methylase [Candidatus Accumulibacter sp. ACC007]|uniref:DNA modification methylase n=1 Tax=Candidatus Accumulibacter sp. ACC007 TaxID=2823333 RepID=UPI0025BAE58B|nr:DNA modification methylase [Candidatus Accumulibacter sp. ACC007]